MNWRTRIARWLLARRDLYVVVERGDDKRWRWYAHSPYRANALVAQSQVNGYGYEVYALTNAREMLEDGHKLQFVTPETWKAICEGRETA